LLLRSDLFGGLIAFDSFACFAVDFDYFSHGSPYEFEMP
jgi:hypothetical protein